MQKLLKNINSLNWCKQMNANFKYTLFNPKEFIDNINENKVQVSIYVEGQQVLDAILNKDKIISILEKAREI